uniref:Uncharacterized protein n=1 Tax=Rhizophora mucronata TaxID=61149 RepID=A0A2P2K605_RHIMU
MNLKMFWGLFHYILKVIHTVSLSLIILGRMPIMVLDQDTIQSSNAVYLSLL